ncbi:hypothetical protein KUTeg_018038 [Tegillarca granosa]|uniref:Treslin STD domain-containing protein n=1 Tax=Tegillarca granosa TaxID=220873 RepID=A0ABQ9EM09_TEGGR|nr:hypothetical protein KUTeg_018038 [Tegillarca granosa]
MNLMPAVKTTDESSSKTLPDESLESTMKITDLVCDSSKSCEDHDITIHKDQSLSTLLYRDGHEVNFLVYGTLRSCNVTGIDFGICKENEYIFTGTTTKCHGSSTRNKEIIEPRSAVFEELLQKLKNSGTSLILSMRRSPCLAIMFPLNKVSATVRILTPGSSLRIEKSLHIQTDSSFSEENYPEMKDLSNSIDANQLSSMLQKTLPKYCNMRKGCSNSSRSRRYGPKCVNKTHLPGCQPAMINLIDKLNERISQLDFLNEDEVKTLKQLQKTYRVENQPLKPREQPTLTPPKDNITTEKDKGLHTEEPVLCKQDSKRGRGSIPSRGEIMVTRSRQSVQVQKEDNTETKVAKKRLESKSNSTDVDIQQSDFKDESELSVYLKDIYDKALSAEDTGLIMCAQTLVLVSLHYMKENNSDNPEDGCSEFMKQYILLEPAKLREKYQNMDTESQKLNKIREYKLQIILRMECLSTLQGADQSMSSDETRTEAIVMMLRTLSFLSEPNFLPEFLEKTLVDSYIHTLPQTLGNIYDELMQPLPELLESMLSPDNRSMNQSVLNQSTASNEGDTSLTKMQPGSVNTVDSLEPLSNKSDVLLKRQGRKSRGRPLVHHPSLADMGPKRQIVVQNKITKIKKGKSSHKKGSLHPGKKKHTDSGQEKVCRNLFEGGEKKKLERRQSIAVMEHTRHSPRKKSKGFSLLKSPKALKSPFKSPTYSRKKMVSETPAHKQKSHPRWKRLEKERRRTLSSCTVNFVEESPVKPDITKRDSPSQNKRALALVRRSFYSAGPMNRSRNLTKSFQLADRIAGRQRNTSGNKSLSSLSQSLLSQFKSPDKNSSFLLSQLMGSPTPPKNTPRKNQGTPLKVAESPSVSMPESPGFSLLRLRDSPALNTRRNKMGNLFDGNGDRECSGKGTKTPRKPELSVSKNLFLSPEQTSRSELSPNRNSVHKKIDNSTPSKTKSVSKNLFLSPSQNTRSKVMSTPTKSSLFDNMDTLNSNNERNTPIKTESQVSKNLYLSPSQNTRSKVTSTPTRSSVRAILFMKSPEPKMPSQPLEDTSTATYFDRKNSPVIKKSNIVNDSEAIMNTNKVKSVTPSNFENEGLIKCSWVDKDGSIKTISVKGDKMPDVSKSMSFDSTNKTPSPRKRVKLDASSPCSQNNSPCQTHVKTPTSLNHWPRRKHVNLGNTNDSKLGAVACSVNSTEDRDRVSWEISRKQYNTEQNEETFGSLQASDLDVTQTRMLSRKRSLALSPESVSSPSKRKRSHLLQSVVNEEQKHLPLSYCLHSRIMSRQSSVFSDTEFSSQGFDTSLFHSSQNSTDSLGISLSQKSTGSTDYFSLSNDEVFLSQAGDQNQRGKILKDLQTVSSPNAGRSGSPVFGSGRKIKKHPTARFSMGQAFEVGPEDVEMVSMETNSNTSENREASNQTQKFSPSGRKYSPNVSAKSLIHLMNSPLLKSPMCGGEIIGKTDANSPRIDQDSLNVRRKKMQGKTSRRSLKLQN